MANIQNLKHFTSDQSRDEAVKNGKKGGKASGKARREKRDMKAELLLVMDELITDKSGKKVTPRKAISLTLLKKALAGDLKAIKLLLEIIGEMPKEGTYTGNNNSMAEFMQGLKEVTK